MWVSGEKSAARRQDLGASGGSCVDRLTSEENPMTEYEFEESFQQLSALSTALSRVHVIR